MLKVYILPIERIDNTDTVRGIEYIHDAILDCTEAPDVRKLIMDTTSEEDSALSSLALEVREPTEQERAIFETLPQPPEPTPPLSTHLARLDGINPGVIKPATVTRTWQGKEYTYDCFVTESVKNQYLAGDIAVGDFVLVHFLEDSADKAVVIAKVFKTW